MIDEIKITSDKYYYVKELGYGIFIWAYGGGSGQCSPKMISTIP